MMLTPDAHNNLYPAAPPNTSHDEACEYDGDAYHTCRCHERWRSEMIAHPWARR